MKNYLKACKTYKLKKLTNDFSGSYFEINIVIKKDD